MVKDLYDVTVIGGGPIGLFTTFYSGMRNLKTKLIECTSELGGKITMFYPEKTLRDIGGITGIKGGNLVEQLIQQARTFNPTICFNQRISDLERLSNGTFLLRSEAGEIHYTRTVILTVGAGIFKPIKLDLPYSERYEQYNLHYSVDELERFRNQRVLISGGGNSAVDWANELVSIAKSVMVVHRNNDFRGHERHVSEMREKTEILTPYTLKQLHGDGDFIQSVTIEHTETGLTKHIEIDALVVNHGIQGDYGKMAHWGLEMREERFVVNHAMETNIPGVFAAGDAVTYPHKLKLIAGGFTEGPIALNSAVRYMNPNAESMAMYSTHHEALLEMNHETLY
ncbi:NAD(P)/FAD-dependent oxidoreductase [Heyndrickxia ginsengihumi]|uniref:NAD(P)/FAD-dependent oxidoreductase n=1 Tax=Heyndrickxia ginsengihumi TaxID=363870 RepID=UPI00046F4E5E|nr:NAD(P)/FAD-dependent oxidoreductase [Heyndrickxia ginsengihumi]MCM3022626.1 NAD(P)/FAD-dependent oxidoreductase [Heyndrickxia ginsengihumi]